MTVLSNCWHQESSQTPSMLFINAAPVFPGFIVTTLTWTSERGLMTPPHSSTAGWQENTTNMFARVYLFAAQQPFIPTFTHSCSANDVPWRQFCHVSIPTIRPVTFIEYVVHWMWVWNAACEEINIFKWRMPIFRWFSLVKHLKTDRLDHTNITPQTSTCFSWSYTSTMPPHFRMQNHISFQAFVHSSVNDTKHMWSQTELHLEVFLFKMKLSSEVACQFSSHEKVALYKCTHKDNWQKETPFKRGDDNLLWGKPVNHEILKLCT